MSCHPIGLWGGNLSPTVYATLCNAFGYSLKMFLGNVAYPIRPQPFGERAHNLL
jgi:hypothetical protein